MSLNNIKPVNPIIIPVVSAPYFLLGSLVAAFNWNRLGFPQKAQKTIKWSIFGTIAIIIIALYIPSETLKKMWSIGVGINLGVGLALRTLQLPDYNQYLSKLQRRR